MTFGTIAPVGFQNGQLVRVSLRAVHAASQVEQVNTLHYDLVNSAIPGEPSNDAQSLADTFRDDVLPAWGATFTSAWGIQPVIVQDEKDPLNPTDPRSEWSAGTSFSGTKAAPGDLLPKAACAVATLRTDHIGKRFRGRLFLGGQLGEADQDDGIFNSTQLAKWQAFLDAIPRQPDLATGASTSVANWVVYSRTQRAANLNPYASPVGVVTLHNRFHWLRSREN